MSFGSELLVEDAPVAASLELDGGTIVARSPMQLFWRRFRSDRVAMASAIFIVLLIIVAIAASPIVSLIGVTGPNQPNNNCPGAASQCALDVFGQPTGPSSLHPFGVDTLGRDVLARVIYGARVSLEVAFIATGIAVLIGVIIGTIAGYFRGWVDSLLSRLMDVVLAFPVLLFAIGLAASCSLGKGCLSGLIQPGQEKSPGWAAPHFSCHAHSERPKRGARSQGDVPCPASPDRSPPMPWSSASGARSRSTGSG